MTTEQIRGVHVYGGYTLFVIGVSFIHWPSAIALGGAVALWLGLKWVG